MATLIFIRALFQGLIADFKKIFTRAEVCIGFLSSDFFIDFFSGTKSVISLADSRIFKRFFQGSYLCIYKGFAL